MRQRRAALYIAIGAVLAVALAACGTAAGPAAGTVVSAQRETITETGSTLLYPLMTTWAHAYEKQYPGVTLTTANTGSGQGIASAKSGTVDIGASDAYLSSGDLVQSPHLLNIPLAVSAQEIVYNIPGYHGNLLLNGKLLAEIYQGTITTWNDPAIRRLNPGATLPADKIVPFHRHDSSGDTFLFTSYVSTQDSGWNNETGYGTTVNWPVPGEQGTGNTGMVKGCLATPGCIAYIGISYQQQALASGRLGEAMLENTDGKYVLPNAGSISAAANSFVSLTPPNETISLIEGPAAVGYPIVNYEYAVVSTRQPNAGKASAVKAFLGWAITTGNQPAYLDTVGFQPLPGALVALGKLQIAEIG